MVAAVRRPDEMELLVPIRIVKAVSDTAEADALGSWRSNVDRCSHQLAAWLDQEGVMRA